MGPKRRCHEAKRTMWVKSLEIDEPKKFGSKGSRQKKTKDFEDMS